MAEIAGLSEFAAALSGLEAAVRVEPPPGFEPWRALCGHAVVNPEHLFALHSLIALAARVAVAAALPRLRSRLVEQRGLGWLHDESSFAQAGLARFPGVLLFDYVATLPAPLATVLEQLVSSFANTPTGPDLYQRRVPPPLRRALGEVYTPPHLADLALDRLGWQPEDDLLDPTCGAGVFLVAAVRRRLAAGFSPERVLCGLHGLDINPLAVLTAKAALAVTLAAVLDAAHPLEMPIRLGNVFDYSDSAIIPRVSFIAGNPPWVKASRLPSGQAEQLRPLCQRLGLAAEHNYVGGIEIDLSALVTFCAVERWLQPGGKLAFYLTASLLSSASGQGFRRFEMPGPAGYCRVLAVDDFKAVAPFEGVSVHPVLLLLQAGGESTDWPVPYRLHERGGQVRELVAAPLAGIGNNPWLKGSADHLEFWRRLFCDGAGACYHARKGVTTDRNGIYFVTATRAQSGLIRIRNNPDLGKTPTLPRREAEIEPTHLFPLLRGRGLRRFHIAPDPELKVIVPQRAMHGDLELARTCPRTLSWFQAFEAELRRRASFRRYQAHQPYWSTWSTGPYSFAPWKVFWREISSRFAAAYLGPVEDPVLGSVVAVPDHKLYFVPVQNEDEAAYLTGLLNAPLIANAITSYAAALGLGTAVVETLGIPAYDPDAAGHRELSALAQAITKRGGDLAESEADQLDRLALSLVVLL